MPHELSLTARQKAKLRNAFENNISADIKFSKAQIPRIIQSGGFLGSLLSEITGPLMKVADLLAENILASLGITACSSTIDVGIQKKIHGFGTTTLIISDEQVDDILKIVQALEGFNILLKGITGKIKNETKEQKGGFLSMLGTLGATLLGNILSSGKGVLKSGYGSKDLQSEKGKGIVRVGYGYKKNILIPPHPLTNFEIQ